jgi:glutathione S-transferase
VTDDAPRIVHHLALAHEWAEATERGGPYERSTIGRSLDEEGFIHCSFPHQVRATAERYYAGRDDVLLLTVDLTRVDAPVVIEDLAGTGEAFPHLYGPLPIEAVVEVRSLVEGLETLSGGR